jgi:Ca2+/H+ antiporter, TMEM165/GDT1 family
MSWVVAASTFLAAAVEWVEALTIVLAVGIVSGWRSAWTGAAGAALVLLAIVAIFGAAVGSFPLGAAQTVVGILLLLFGLRWLQKAIRRSAGLKALHDEAAEFEETRAKIETLSAGGVATAFNGVLLEGTEVVFIVVALGGLHSLGSATVGAVVALAVVAAAGVALRSPLTRVPENAMKYVVGLMLSAFGTFFAGEGIGWWHRDLLVLPIVAGYAVVSLLLVAALRARRQPVSRLS